MTLHASDAAELPLDTDARIRERVLDLVGPALRPQLWLLFLDAADRQLPLVMPCDDLPERPTEQDRCMLARFICDVCDATEAAQALLVWERPGTAERSAAEQEWMNGLGRLVADGGGRVRAQLISHDRGVAWIPADEWI